MEHVHGGGGSDLHFADPEGFECVFDAAHGGDEVAPRGIGGAADDFVPDEDVTDAGLGEEGCDVRGHPFVGEGLVGGDVGDEFVGYHDGDLEARVPKRVEDRGVGVVELHALGVKGG